MELRGKPLARVPSEFASRVKEAAWRIVFDLGDNTIDEERNSNDCHATQEWHTRPPGNQSAAGYTQGGKQLEIDTRQVHLNL
ncbi:hypothetical protein AGMMS50256_18300 [Betaproteobacteria bacterium]|nr:hypothetical protein AGMMS50256_18300 [Betaproteobacteria bacterium]